MHTGLGAGLFQKLLSIPFLFHGHLRKQESLVCAVLHEQPVLADLDLLNVHHTPKGREHGDFVLELRQLRGRYGLEPWIAQCGQRGCVPHGHVEGLDRGGIADASSERTRLTQGHKRTVLLIEHIVCARGWFIRLFFSYRVLRRLARQREQFGFLLFIQRERSFHSFPVLSFHKDVRAVSDHTGAIACHIA